MTGNGYRQLNTWTHVRGSPSSGLSARAEIIRNLQTRLRLADYWRAHPDVFEDRRTGVHRRTPRTGTSILLDSPPVIRGSVPSPQAHFRPDRSPVWTGLRQGFEPEQEFWADIHPDFQAMHELRSDLPCNASISSSPNSGAGTGR